MQCRISPALLRISFRHFYKYAIKGSLFRCSTLLHVVQCMIACEHELRVIDLAAYALTRLGIHRVLFYSVSRCCIGPMTEAITKTIHI